MKLSLTIAMLSLTVLLAGCSHADQPAQKSPAQASSVKTPKVASSSSPAVGSAASSQPRHAGNPPRWLPDPNASMASIPAFKTIGVPACDQFGVALHQCLPNMRGMHADNTRRLFEGRLAAWQKALASGTSANDVASQCTNFIARIKPRLRAMGCRL